MSRIKIVYFIFSVGAKENFGHERDRDGQGQVVADFRIVTSEDGIGISCDKLAVRVLA